MSLVTRCYSRLIALLLVCALVAVSAPVAEARQITPDKVHERILKRGLGNWVGVELDNGTAIVGRIVAIDEQSFGLQLHNDPAITTLRYANVAELHTGASRGGFWTFAIVGFVAVGVATTVGFYEVHKHDQMPTLPSQPAFP